MSHTAAVLLFERSPPPRHHFELDSVGGDIAPHIPNPEPCRPPDFFAGQVGASGPFMSADVDLKRGTDRTGRIAPRGFRLVAGELIDIDQRRRFTLADRLPPAVPFGGKRPCLGAVRTASDNLEAERPHFTGRAPIPATGNRRVVGNLDPTHRTAASARRTPPQRALRPARSSIREIAADTALTATFPQLRCNRGQWWDRDRGIFVHAMPRGTSRSSPRIGQVIRRRSRLSRLRAMECAAVGSFGIVDQFSSLSRAR